MHGFFLFCFVLFCFPVVDVQSEYPTHIYVNVEFFVGWFFSTHLYIILRNGKLDGWTT